jgi:hypothetical protein
VAVSSDQLDQICRIPERMTGRALRDLIAEAHYIELRPHLSRDDLATHLAKHPGLVLTWLRYSEDKRTSGGWYLLHPASGWLVGRLGGRELRFGSGPEACAEFILRELDGVADGMVAAPDRG